MVDKNGANYCAIRQVLNLNSMTSNVVSCHRHYKHDVNKASLGTGVSFRDESKIICYEICTLATVAQYNDKK